MPEQYVNDAQTMLAGDIASGDTTLTVTGTLGFPTQGNFRIRIDNELLLVTAVSGLTWAVTRAIESIGGNQVAEAHHAESLVTHVLTAGSLAALVSGGGNSSQVTWQNNDAFLHTLGQVVYLSGSDGVKLAKADDPSRANAVALVAQANISSLTTGLYQIVGVLSGLSGLITDAVYYLSDGTAGLLTTTPPTVAGHLVVELGVAISPTEFLIRIRRAFML
jgi:hypothetical protein